MQRIVSRVIITPSSCVGVVTAFGRLGVDIVGVLNICSTVGADMPKFAIFTNLYLVFMNVPYIFKSLFFNSLTERSIAYVAIAFGHRRAIFDVTFDIYRNLAIEAGIVLLGFQKSCKID
jgi:hypothetical protein